MLGGFIFILSLISQLASSHSITGKLDVPVLGPQESFGTNIHLTDLEDRRITKGFLQQDGSFEFVGLSEGSYLIEVDMLNYILEYPCINVEIKKEAVLQDDGTLKEETAIMAYEYQMGHPVHDLTNEIEYPLVISPHPKHSTKLYYEQKNKGLAATGQLGAIISNPWLLGGGCLMAVTLLLPMIIEKVDPEYAEKKLMADLDEGDSPSVDQLFPATSGEKQQIVMGHQQRSGNKSNKK
ncbi:hypothetical protein DASC09_018420 [Saccharomycopsis crataegensis]|uniref:ER membrane protein complex subunit 7 beta-sandwich domain-containing protein n=1 Tax=Saccharomycopsis crataegensis TaxID=43959 RepID=A0AAV5QIT3_9ASCO|nr:hypothetical protein DASC09_018420 [Saccharomycopsis crataegensis]